MNANAELASATKLFLQLLAAGCMGLLLMLSGTRVVVCSGLVRCWFQVPGNLDRSWGSQRARLTRSANS